MRTAVAVGVAVLLAAVLGLMALGASADGDSATAQSGLTPEKLADAAADLYRKDPREAWLK